MVNNTDKLKMLNIDLVNKCETLEELATVIEMIGAQHLEDDRIQGRFHEFNSDRMSACCKNIQAHQITALTRNYGIRQQACYILMSLENAKVRKEQIKNFQSMING